MHLIHFVINISQKCMFSADVWKYRNSVLGHEDWQRIPSRRALYRKVPTTKTIPFNHSSRMECVCWFDDRWYHCHSEVESWSGVRAQFRWESIW